MRIHHMENVKKALDFMKYKKVCKYVRMYMHGCICMCLQLIVIKD